MGLMQKLRSSTKYMIWILILSFGLLWVLADTQVFDAMMAGPRNMGEVNREPISYNEFNQRVNLYSERHRESTGASPDTEVRAQFEELAWEQLVVDKILKGKMQQIGITVTDSELVDMVAGENPDPFIREQFSLEDGTIDRVALQNAIDTPENREIWIMVEQQLREQRRKQKFDQFVESSFRVSEFEIKNHYIENNSVADFQYIRFPYSDISTSDVEVSDSEIRNYYQNNRERFQQDKTWDFSYVTFSKDATSQDTAATKDLLSELRDDFRQAEDIPGFLSDHYSETDYTESFIKPSEISHQYLILFEMEIDDVSEPFVYNNRVHMVRLLEDRPSDETYVHVRQIKMDRGEYSLEDANDLIGQYERGWTFHMIMGDYSSENEEAESGYLGYLTRDSKPEELAEPIFNADVGSVIGPIEYDNNYYIFQIVDRTNREVRFADLSRDVEPDPFQTVQQRANEAEDFHYFAETDGFYVEAERIRLQVRDAVAREGNPFIPGLGQSRTILNELAQLREGDMSDLIETEDKFLVLKVGNITPGGTRPLEEVRSQIRARLLEKNRQEMMSQRVNEMLATTSNLEELAEQSGKPIQNVEQIQMSQSTLPGIGSEPKVIGAAFSLQEETLSPAITGNAGVFVIKLGYRAMADPGQITSEDRNQIQEELLQRNNAAFGSVWIDRLKADADIRDFRTRQRLMMQ